MVASRVEDSFQYCRKVQIRPYLCSIPETVDVPRRGRFRHMLSYPLVSQFFYPNVNIHGLQPMLPFITVRVLTYEVDKWKSAFVMFCLARDV